MTEAPTRAPLDEMLDAIVARESPAPTVTGIVWPPMVIPSVPERPSAAVFEGSVIPLVRCAWASERTCTVCDPGSGLPEVEATTEGSLEDAVYDEYCKGSDTAGAADWRADSCDENAEMACEALEIFACCVCSAVSGSVATATSWLVMPAVSIPAPTPRPVRLTVVA